MNFPRTVRAVYTGICTLQDRMQGATLHLLDDEGVVTSSELLFARKTMTGSSIGGMYEFQQVSETSFRVSERKYVGQYSNVEDRASWQLAAKAREMAEEAKRMEKKDKAVIAAVELLAPLRRVYHSSLPDRRRAIELLLLDYLRRRD